MQQTFSYKKKTEIEDNAIKDTRNIFKLKKENEAIKERKRE